MEHVLEVVEEGQECWQEEESQTDPAEIELPQQEQLEDVEETGHNRHYGQYCLSHHRHDGVEIGGPRHSSVVKE